MAKRHRSSKTGKLVTAKYAKKHKATTVTEKVKKRHVLGVGYPMFVGRDALYVCLATSDGSLCHLKYKRPKSTKKYRLILEEV